VEKLRQGADEGLLIAAVSHDIERSERKLREPAKNFLDPEYLREHQERGAFMVGEFLQAHGAPEELVQRVEHLVSKHEVGGDEDQNLLKDADSLSFFETQVEYFVEEKVKESGAEAIKAKFQWMFDRISSEEAKNKARPMYEQAMRRLTGQK
jgi:hypothetical protein